MATESTTAQGQVQSDSLSRVAIALLKGVVYAESDPALWQDLVALQARVREYMAVLGLVLQLDEAEGHAFLRTRIADEEKELPRLVARRPLSFPVSLILALLRKRLAETDTGGGDTRLIMSRDEIVELVQVFVRSGSNEAKVVDQVTTHLKKIEDLGFIRPLRGQDHVYEVRRLLKSFVDAQWLSDFDKRLAAYRGQSGAETDKDDAS